MFKELKKKVQDKTQNVNAQQIILTYYTLLRIL